MLGVVELGFSLGQEPMNHQITLGVKTGLPLYKRCLSCIDS